MFVFYDTETTGLDMDFTQILQIGMLFTDDDLNILSTKKIDCRNSVWDVPAPAALLTTGFTPANLKASKNSNFDMMQEVNRWLRSQHWPLTFVGYNNIDYDEPVLAQNFYQNLLFPYLTSSKSQIEGQPNGRADVLYMVQMAALYTPGVLKLDALNNSGTPSLTLKNVAAQNGVGLSDADAHDALNDIKATLGVAKLIKKAAPHIWDQGLALSTVEGVDKFLNDHEIFTFARFMYGRTDKSSVMTSLAERKGSKTQALFDLRVDPAPYLAMSVDELKDVFLLKKGSPFVLARKESQPILMPMEYSDAVLRESDDVALFKRRAKALKADPAFLEKVARAMLLAKQAQLAAGPQFSSKMPEVLINKRVAAPARGKLDAWSKEFRDAANWHDRAVLAGDFNARFKDELTADPLLERFGKLATRLVFEHAPQELTAAKQEAMNKFIANRILNPDLKAPYMTIARARKELAKIEADRADPKGKKWNEVTTADITNLKGYYTRMETAYAKYYQPQQQPPANNNDMSALQVPPVLVVKKPNVGNIQPKP